MINNKVVKVAGVVLSTTLAIDITGCGSTAQSSTKSTIPASEIFSSVESTYDDARSLDGLIGRSEIIIGTVTASKGLAIDILAPGETIGRKANRSTTEPPLAHYMIQTEWTIKVEESVKPGGAPKPGATILVRSEGGAYGGIDYPNSDAPPFRIGSRYLMFVCCGQTLFTSTRREVLEIMNDRATFIQPEDRRGDQVYLRELDGLPLSAVLARLRATATPSPASATTASSISHS